jgi:hypothetical protein
MSPEQAMGELVDARSDIFSLGIVLYQLLTGARPFVDSSSSIGEVFRKLCEEAPTAPQEINPSVPSSLAEVVLKSLAKQPEQRFQTVDEFMSSLIESNPRKTLSRPRLSLKRREKENEKSPVAFTNGFHFSDIFGELSGGAAGNAEEISPPTEETSSARSSELKDASERTLEDVRQSYRVTDERIRDGAQQMNLEDVTLQSGARDSDPTASGLLPYRPTPSTRREELTQYPSAIAWLRVYDSAHAQREFRLAGKVTIGRSGFPLPSLEAAEIEREIVISDPLVSRQHACISLENNHFYITDMGSWHGTFVNGEQIQKHELGHGDEITVGGTLIVFTQSLLPGTLAEAKGVTPEVLAEANKLGVSPGILAEAKRIQKSEAKRLQEFSTIWDQLTSSARYVR